MKKIQFFELCKITIQKIVSFTVYGDNDKKNNNNIAQKIKFINDQLEKKN